MDVEKQITELLGNPRSAFLLFYVLQGAYYSMLIGGYFVMIYVLFGLTTMFYVAGAAFAGGLIAYAFYKLFGERMFFKRQ